MEFSIGDYYIIFYMPTAPYRFTECLMVYKKEKDPTNKSYGNYFYEVKILTLYYTTTWY